MDDAKARNDLPKITSLEGLADKPPVILNVAKQRNGDWEGRIGLWFNRETYQYRSSQDHVHGNRYVNVEQDQDGI